MIQMKYLQRLSSSSSSDGRENIASQSRKPLQSFWWWRTAGDTCREIEKQHPSNFNELPFEWKNNDSYQYDDDSRCCLIDKQWPECLLLLLVIIIWEDVISIVKIISRSVSMGSTNRIHSFVLAFDGSAEGRTRLERDADYWSRERDCNERERQQTDAVSFLRRRLKRNDIHLRYYHSHPKIFQLKTLKPRRVMEYTKYGDLFSASRLINLSRRRKFAKKTAMLLELSMPLFLLRASEFVSIN